MRLILVCAGLEGTGATFDGEDLAHEKHKRQAQAVAREIAAHSERGPSIAAVYSSPSAAALTTAEATALSLGLAPVEHEALSPPVDTEDHAEMLARQEEIWSAIEGLRERHEQDGAVVAVMQAIVIRLLVGRAISIPLGELHRFRLDVGSISWIDFRPQRPLLLASLNETCHLDGLTGPG